jgi:tetratricopeptide (TPR) repeat protein
MNNYKQALRYKRSKGYSWALFKLGWRYYNLSDFPKSLEFWKATVSNARQAEDKSVAQLRDEALRDMVYSFAELKQVEPAINYYRANGGEKYISQFLLLLANVFTDQGQYGEAITTLKRFQAGRPEQSGCSGCPEGHSLPDV